MPGCYIQALNGITFGESVFIGPGVKIISANHSLDDLTAHDPTPPIVIEDNCWIGANAVVLPGVHLGVGTIVGAGAVVTKSFAAGHCVIAGNPARIIRRLASTSDELRTDIVPNSETGI
jgi:acetyltransferase-like isoleucine patch superfamily enzyme